MVLSRPISRTAFLLGKIIGLSSVLLINTAILSSMSIFIFYYLKGTISMLMLWASWFSFMEAFIVMLFAVLFSLLTSNALAVIYTIVLWVAGHAITATLQSIFAKNNIVFSAMLKLSSCLIPDLEKINLKDFLIYEQKISLSYLFKSQSYAFIYIIGQLLII